MASNMSMYYGLAAVAGLVGIGVYAASKPAAPVLGPNRPRPPMSLNLPALRQAYGDLIAAANGAPTNANGFVSLDESLVTPADQTALITTTLQQYAANPGLSAELQTALQGYANLLGPRSTANPWPPWLAYALAATSPSMIAAVTAPGVTQATLTNLLALANQGVSPSQAATAATLVQLGLAKPRRTPPASLGRPLVPGPIVVRKIARRVPPMRARFAATQARAGRATGLPF